MTGEILLLTTEVLIENVFSVLTFYQSVAYHNVVGYWHLCVCMLLLNFQPVRLWLILLKNMMFWLFILFKSCFQIAKPMCSLCQDKFWLHAFRYYVLSRQTSDWDMIVLFKTLEYVLEKMCGDVSEFVLHKLKHVFGKNYKI